MKNIYKFLAGAVALTAVFSCSKLNDYPAFEDGESFAAFDVISVTVNEDAGTVSIPVTIGSVDPKQVAVAYAAADGTAKAGVDYSLADASAVLAFDGKTRTMNIEINIMQFAGEYTGDKMFSVSLVSAGGLKLGKNSTCSVRIADLDHPLASILGDYTVYGTENWDGDLSWAATFEKDDSDVTVVWISNFVNFGKKVYGNVSEDMTTVTIPLGQSFVYNSTYTGKLVGFGPIDGKLYYETEGSIVLTKTDDGWVQTSTMDAGEELWGYAYLAFITETDSPYSWFTAYYPGVKFTKN